MQPLRRSPVQRINHRVAGSVDRIVGDCLVPQILRCGIRRRKTRRGDQRSNATVHLLRPGMVDVARPQSRLNTRHRHLAVIGGKGLDYRGGVVTLHDSEVRPLRVHNVAELDQHSRGEVIERLPGLQQVEIDTGHDIGNREHLTNPRCCAVTQVQTLRPGIATSARTTGKFDRLTPGTNDNETRYQFCSSRSF